MGPAALPVQLPTKVADLYEGLAEDPVVECVRQASGHKAGSEPYRHHIRTRSL